MSLNLKLFNKIVFNIFKNKELFFKDKYYQQLENILLNDCKKSEFNIQTVNELIKKHKLNVNVLDLKISDISDYDDTKKSITYGNINAIKVLLENNYKITHHDLVDALRFVHLDIAQLMISYGADVNINHGYPLKKAVNCSNKDFIEFCMNNGANPLLPDKNNLLNALVCAASQPNSNIVQYFLDKGYSFEPFQEACIVWATLHGHLENLKIFNKLGFNLFFNDGLIYDLLFDIRDDVPYHINEIQRNHIPCSAENKKNIFNFLIENDKDNKFFNNKKLCAFEDLSKLCENEFKETVYQTIISKKNNADLNSALKEGKNKNKQKI